MNCGYKNPHACHRGAVRFYYWLENDGWFIRLNRCDKHKVASIYHYKTAEQRDQALALAKLEAL